MNLLDPQLLIASLIFTVILFGVVAFLTRASLRRMIGALISAAPIIPLVLLYDTIAARMGWWYYPSFRDSPAPFAWYVAAALGYGAAFGLIGWRVIRRWAMPGLVFFIVLFAFIGVTRDYIYSTTTQIIAFGQGPIPWLADLFAYASAALLVQLLMRLVAGPAHSDFLARASKPRI